MAVIFYISAAIAIIATLIAITRLNPVHALLYFIVSLLATGLIFFVLGAPFAAAVVVIINAGAIMVLFVFVVMMLKPSAEAKERGKKRISSKLQPLAFLLALILLAEFVYVLMKNAKNIFANQVIGPKQIGLALFGPYLLAVEMISIVLLVGLLGAHHLSRKNISKN